MLLKRYLMKKHVIRNILNVQIIIMTIIYVLGNIETILIYSYWENKDNDNHPWLKYQELPYSLFGPKRGMDFFYNINNVSWWFVENHKNIIFFCIITILMVISLIMGKKLKALNKAIIAYYVICFFIMIFIAFFASPKFADYYF